MALNQPPKKLTIPEPDSLEAWTLHTIRYRAIVSPEELRTRNPRLNQNLLIRTGSGKAECLTLKVQGESYRCQKFFSK